ncbi:hypothetical protein PVAP13_5KG494307 [Panicum virgatum]|uniref:Uncharacterized protein n=1 Tax=Panicum virgatum TaxID=38727 RepID=A0A8T0SPT0_PANVG|nr:hypothetical protein PVAP13_5KG494307 [Panicum virgatum]
MPVPPPPPLHRLAPSPSLLPPSCSPPPSFLYRELRQPRALRPPLSLSPSPCIAALRLLARHGQPRPWPTHTAARHSRRGGRATAQRRAAEPRLRRHASSTPAARGRAPPPGSQGRRRRSVWARDGDGSTCGAEAKPPRSVCGADRGRAGEPPARPSAGAPASRPVRIHSALYRTRRRRREAGEAEPPTPPRPTPATRPTAGPCSGLQTWLLCPPSASPQVPAPLASRWASVIPLAAV